MWVSFDGESRARELLLHPSFLLSDSVEGLEHIMTPSCINDSSNWKVDVLTHVPWALGPASQAPSLSPRSHHRDHQTYLEDQIRECFCSFYSVSSSFYSPFPKEESRLKVY